MLTTATFAVLSLALTSCTGELLELGNETVRFEDTFFISTESAWVAHRDATGLGFRVAPSSRCYVQRAEGAVEDSLALCGPIHYVGQDKTTWDAVRVSADGNRAIITPGSRFTVVLSPSRGSELFRTDELVADTQEEVLEPSAPFADALIPTISSGSFKIGTPSTIKTPAGSFTITGVRSSTHVGSVGGRLQAPVGHRFVSFALDATKPKDAAVKIVFIHKDKSIPVKGSASGIYSIAVPSADSVMLGIEYKGHVQTISGQTGEVGSRPPGLYDNLAEEFTPSKVAFVGGREKFDDVQVSSPLITSRAYDPELGWAADGDKWLTFTGSVATGGSALKRATVAAGEATGSTADGTMLELSSYTVTPDASDRPMSQIKAVFLIPSGPTGQKVDLEMGLTVEDLWGFQSLSTGEVSADFAPRANSRTQTK